LRDTIASVSAETERLPHIDEHAAVADAGAEATWEALLRVVGASFEGGPTPRLAALLGCADTAASGPRPLATGSTVPGFRVAAATAPRQLALAGSHRFSRYALVFRLDPLDAGRTRLRAETRAEFPGLKGSIYHSLVIGTRLHVLVTRRILTATKTRADGPKTHGYGAK
jgi:hypothetical protein